MRFNRSIHQLTLLIAVFFGILTNSGAQDIQLSQYYNINQLYNPAFTGTAYALRASIHQRLQWPSLHARYSTTLISTDYNWKKYNSGIGAVFLYDQQGSSYIRNYATVFQYSYLAELNSRLSFRGGLSTGLVRRVLSTSEMMLPEQFNGNGFDKYEGNRFSKNYVDISAGILLYTDRWWLGISSNHLNTPNQSFIGEIERLPLKFDILTGIKIPIKKLATMRYLEATDEDIFALYPTLLYKWQGKSDQLDLGLYGIYRFVKTGIWYRGIPVKNYHQHLPNHESLSFVGGLKFSSFSLDYSYDYVISKLNSYSGGAHEINLTFYYPKNPGKGKHKVKKLPCPHFYGYKN